MNADVARRNPYRIPGSAALTQATETVTGYIGRFSESSKLTSTNNAGAIVSL
jgi:hypothetical protein